ncbi:MAG: SigB/SigF/SigG family RNA polymerase sigma factor [Mycobacteriales bacterium]
MDVATLPRAGPPALPTPPYPAPTDLLDGRGDGGRGDRARPLFCRLAGLAPGTVQHRELRDQLVEMHLPLARYFARRYTGRSEPFDDLVQAASVGLVKAVDRFDPWRGMAFSTFAAPTILGEIRRHFRDHTWAVHVQRTLQELSGQVSRAAREMSQELGRSPTVPEVAARTGLSEERITESLACSAAYATVSFETPAGEDHTLGDRLGGDDPALDHVELHESLGRALAVLPYREQQILQLRYYGNLTQAQIAARLGISQMHVSRLLGRILSRLRQELVPDD